MTFETPYKKENKMSHTSVLADLDLPMGGTELEEGSERTEASKQNYLNTEKKFYIAKAATPLAKAMIAFFVGFNFSYNVFTSKRTFDFIKEVYERGALILFLETFGAFSDFIARATTVLSYDDGIVESMFADQQDYRQWTSRLFILFPEFISSCPLAVYRYCKFSEEQHKAHQRNLNKAKIISYILETVKTTKCKKIHELKCAKSKKEEALEKLNKGLEKGDIEALKKELKRARSEKKKSLLSLNRYLEDEHNALPLSSTKGQYKHITQSSEHEIDELSETAVTAMSRTLQNMYELRIEAYKNVLEAKAKDGSKVPEAELDINEFLTIDIIMDRAEFTELTTDDSFLRALRFISNNYVKLQLLTTAPAETNSLTDSSSTDSLSSTASPSTHDSQSPPREISSFDIEAPGSPAVIEGTDRPASRSRHSEPFVSKELVEVAGNHGSPRLGIINFSAEYTPEYFQKGFYYTNHQKSILEQCYAALSLIFSVEGVCWLTLGVIPAAQNFLKGVVTGLALFNLKIENYSTPLQLFLLYIIMATLSRAKMIINWHLKTPGSVRRTCDAWEDLKRDGLTPTLPDSVLDFLIDMVALFFVICLVAYYFGDGLFFGTEGLESILTVAGNIANIDLTLDAKMLFILRLFFGFGQAGQSALTQGYSTYTGFRSKIKETIKHCLERDYDPDKKNPLSFLWERPFYYNLANSILFGASGFFTTKVIFDQIIPDKHHGQELIWEIIVALAVGITNLCFTSDLLSSGGLLSIEALFGDDLDTSWKGRSIKWALGINQYKTSLPSEEEQQVAPAVADASTPIPEKGSVSSWCCCWRTQPPSRPPLDRERRRGYNRMKDNQQI